MVVTYAVIKPSGKTRARIFNVTKVNFLYSRVEVIAKHPGESDAHIYMLACDEILRVTEDPKNKKQIPARFRS